VFYLTSSEIASSIMNVANDNKEINWKDVLIDLKPTICDNYNGKDTNVFRGD
ncbi:hypothetical protein BCR42DRAFT_336549, partial [Absidia repens]